MRNNSFTFNGRSSDEFGIKIERFRPLNRPPRKYDAAAVSGRNGNIYKLQDAWEEILVSYEIFAKASIADTEADFSKIDGTYFAWTADGLTVNGTVPAPYEIEEAAELLAWKNRTIIVQGGETGVWELECRVVDNYGTTTRTATITNGSETFVLGVGDYLYIDLKLYSGTYTNEVIPLKIIDGEILDLPKKWTEIMEWLNSADGYAELSDSFDPDHYRKAVFVDATDIQNSWNHYGRAVVSFHCRPERFLLGYKGIELDLSETVTFGICTFLTYLLDSPTAPQTILATLPKNTQFKIVSTSSGYYNAILSDGRSGYISTSSATTSTGCEIFNPTKHSAKPTFRLKTSLFGTYSLRVNTITMTVTPSLIPDNIEVDCENENISYLNAETTLTDISGNISPSFLSFQSGYNWLVVGSGFTAVNFDANFWEI